MKILCSLGIHDWTQVDTKIEYNKKDRGAVIEEVREKFDVHRCKKCGAKKKKIHKSWSPHGGKKKERRVVDKKWKDEVDGNEQ